MAILTTSSLAAIKINPSEIKPQMVDWPENLSHTFKYFNSSLGRLIQVDFAATLDGNMSVVSENRNNNSSASCYFSGKVNLYVSMINKKDRVSLSIDLKVPQNGTPADLDPFTEPYWEGGDTLIGHDEDHDEKSIPPYVATGDLAEYIGNGNFSLDAKGDANFTIVAGGNQTSNISTFGWSNATLIYTYDPRGLSGYKKDGCTNLPLSGWKIIVTNSTHQWNATTDANGFWQVYNLTNGTYTVCEALQPGWIQTSSPACHTVTLAGFAVANINFTNRRLHSISGYKLGCNNSPISGWNITLKNDTHTASMLTGPDGRYEFCNLLPGSYTLTEENRTGYKAVSVVSNPLELNCSNFTNQNFTNSQLFCIGGRKVDDCTGEGLSGWQITVKNASNGQIVGQNNSIGGGHWTVCELLPGEYQVTETLQTGWKNITNLTQNVTLGCENKTGVDFHNVELLCLGGRKTDYCTGLGFSGWTVVVKNTTTGKTDIATTNATGYWSVFSLQFGYYNVSEVLQSGWTNVTPISQAVVLPCSSKLDVNFVNRKLLCISGYKKDNCGTATLPGWDITIHNATGYNRTKTTDSNGKFEFCDLSPGLYTLTETVKPGWISTSSVSLDVNLNCSNITNQNFTNQMLLCISGYKKDNCGGDTLPGWDITIHNSTGYNVTKTTDSTGKFEFCDLSPGQYTLTEALKPGWIRVSSPSEITL